jgi:hypothetical protein
MKTKINILFTLTLFATTAINAQNIQRGTIAERVKTTMDKISAPLKLDVSQADRTDSVFTEFYETQNKMMPKGAYPDKSAFDKILNERDEKLKIIFTSDQYTKFKNKEEDLLRPYWQSHEGN